MELAACQAEWAALESVALGGHQATMMEVQAVQAVPAVVAVVQSMDPEVAVAAHQPWVRPCPPTPRSRVHPRWR